MKRISIATLLLAATLSSCSLDITPENAQTYSTSFNDEAGVNAATASIEYFINVNVPNNNTFTTVGIFADTLQDGMEVRRWNPRLVIAQNESWKELYDIIFTSNVIVDNIDKAKSLTDDRRNHYLGQAEFGLGLGYFLLAQRFDDAVITENSYVIKEYATSSRMDVINTAIDHATKAFNMLPTYDKLRKMDGTPITNRQTASKGTCAALLAHLYAWKGSIIELLKLEGNAQEAYTKSMEYSTMLINKQVGDYSLCSTPEELCEYLSAPEKTNPEAIFSLYYDKARSAQTYSPNKVAENFVSWPVDETQTLADIASQPRFKLYKETISKLYPDAGDLRRTAFFYKFDTNHTYGGHNYAIPYKFRTAVIDPDQTTSSGKLYRSINADYVYWRLADFYLLRAECAAKLGNDAQAIADLNVIRNRAGATAYPSANDTKGLRKAIFREREREFIAENDARYADIIRNNYIKDELTGKFTTLTLSDIRGGALGLPLPIDAKTDKDGNPINKVIRQKTYWQRYE